MNRVGEVTNTTFQMSLAESNSPIQFHALLSFKITNLKVTLRDRDRSTNPLPAGKKLEH